MEFLDLEGVYLTQSSLRMVATICTQVKVLSFKNCGYAITDHQIKIIVKVFLINTN